MRLPMHDRADEAGDAGVDVDDGAAGEVERAPLEEQAGIGERRVELGLRRRLGVGVSGFGDGLGCIGEGVGAAPVPDHVGDREIDEGHPQDR